MANEKGPAEMQRIRDKAKAVDDPHGTAIGDDALAVAFGELERIRGG